jgi:S-adenosylmethionine hydrolase
VLPYFPPAVHLVVVDPTVGTDRRAIVLRVGDHALVGPDNGVLRPAARRLRIGEHEDGADDVAVEAFEIVGFDPASATFHGRDVFAPAAAVVHELGVDAIHEDDRFRAIEEPVDLRFPEPSIGDDGAHGEVLAVDDFGNVITNVPGDVVADACGDPIAVNDRAIEVVESYAGVSVGDPLLTVGSHGNVELAVREGRGDEAFGLVAGDAVTLDW